MESTLIKYLIIKMISGKGYSASLEEIEKLEKYLRDNGYKIKLEKANNYIKNNGNYLEANYNLNRNIFDINGIKIEEYRLLKSFIEKLEDVKIDNLSEEMFNRCEEILVYLIEVLTSAYSSPNLLLEELPTIELVPVEMKRAFSELSTRSAYLLQYDDELVISNNNLIKNDRLSYRTFFNNKFVTSDIKDIINKYTRDNEIKYIVDFGNAKYFGIPSFKQDMLAVFDNKSVIEPIYIPRISAIDQSISDSQNRKIEEAQENIKRLKL